MRISLFTLQHILQGLYRPGLDCDGQSRVFHAVLTELEIPHLLYAGSIEERDGQRGTSPHFWIRLSVKEDWAIIDFKARKWLGDDEKIPHGAFLVKDWPHILYQGRSLNEPPISPTMMTLFLSSVFATDPVTGETVETL